MEKSKWIQGLLVISGIIGIGIGAALLLAPIAFESSVGITLGDNVNLISEIRAPGGALLSGGVMILLGAFNSKFTYASLVLTCVLFLSYGTARMLSIIIDGVPHISLLSAMVIEIIIGLISLLLLSRWGNKELYSS